MIQNTVDTNKYQEAIRRIQNRRTAVKIVSVIAILLLLAVCIPGHIEILGVTLLETKGIHPAVTVLLVVLLVLLEIVVYAMVEIPLINSLDAECDPEKYLILNDVLGNQKQKSSVYSLAFLYMGQFEAALYYANQMMVDNPKKLMLPGLSNKALCEFFLGDYTALKATVAQFDDTLNTTDKLSKNLKTSYEKIQKTLHLLVAIADEDQESITALSDISAWSQSKIAQGYTAFLQGLTAFHLKNDHEAVYRFMYVKEHCPKTIFAQLSEQYLSNLNKDA